MKTSSTGEKNKDDTTENKSQKPSLSMRRKLSTELSIHLDNSHVTVQAGQDMTGTIKLHVHSDSIRANRLTLVFSGGEHTFLKYTKNRAQSYESLIHEQIPISRQFLWKESSSSDGSTADSHEANKKNDDRILQGSYEIPFAFRLPRHLPASQKIIHPWDCVNKCEITYKLKAVLEVIPSSCPCVLASTFTMIPAFLARTSSRHRASCQRQKAQIRVIVKQPVPVVVDSSQHSNVSWNGGTGHILVSGSEEEEENSNDLAHRIFLWRNRAPDIILRQRIRLIGASIVEDQSSVSATTQSSPYHVVPGQPVCLEWILDKNSSRLEVDSIHVSLRQSLKWNIKGPYLQYGSTQTLWSKRVPMIMKNERLDDPSKNNHFIKSERPSSSCGGGSTMAAIHPSSEEPLPEGDARGVNDRCSTIVVPFSIPKDCWMSYYNGTLMKIKHELVIRAHLTTKKKAATSLPSWMWKVRPLHIPLVVVESLEANDLATGSYS